MDREIDQFEDNRAAHGGVHQGKWESSDHQGYRPDLNRQARVQHPHPEILLIGHRRVHAVAPQRGLHSDHHAFG